jgi:hypothetical protein
MINNLDNLYQRNYQAGDIGGGAGGLRDTGTWTAVVTVATAHIFREKRGRGGDTVTRTAVATVATAHISKTASDAPCEQGEVRRWWGVGAHTYLNFPHTQI